MPYVITTGTAPQTSKFRGLQINLINSLNYAYEINRQLDQMTDADASAQYGIPVGTVPAIRTNIDNLIATLESESVINFVSSLGFGS